MWYVIQFFIVWLVLHWLSRQFKEKPEIKTAKDYQKEHPEVFEDAPPVEQHIHFHITNNNLHIHPKDEGN